LSADDDTQNLSFNPAYRYDVDITYTVDAVNAPRKDSLATDSYQGYYTVAERNLCVMNIEMEEISFGENQSEMLEAVFDIKCIIKDCGAPFASFRFGDTDGQSSETYGRDLRDDEIADCMKDTTRVTFVEKNKKGCFMPKLKFADGYEPVISTTNAYG